MSRSLYADVKNENTWWGWFRGLWKAKPEEEEYDFENPQPYAPPRFEADDPKLAEYFKEYGYVVVKNVANEEERNTAISLFWDLAEQSRPEVKRNDPATWRDENWVADTTVGIMSGYGIGQSAFMWYSRLLPKVKQAFTNAWGNDDLLVSFDGCGIFRPPEFNPKWKTRGAWYHIDQNLYKRPGLNAIQGLVNYFPSGPNDGGFVVVPRSTHMLDAAFEKIPDICSPKGRDYVRMYPDYFFWKEARDVIGKRNESNRYDLLPVKLVLEAGDLVLWDSRAIHCNHPVTQASTSPDAATHLKRLTAYVCMTPTSLAKNVEQLAKYRVLAFQKGITTTHWPHEFYPSWSVREKIPGVGASVVKLNNEQKTLITGKGLDWDVYDEKLVADVSLDKLEDD